MAFRSRLRSNAGCANCKKRRKKCDEEKPVCGACRRHLLQCSYTPVKRVESQSTVARNSGPDQEVVAKYFQQRQTVPRGIDLSAYKGQICAAQTLDLCFQVTGTVFKISKRAWQLTYYQGDNNIFDPINTDRNGGSIQSTFSFAPAHGSLAWDCFVALGLLVVGHRVQDHNLIQDGRSHHVKALNQVRSSIDSEDERYSLDTLAAVCQLGILSVSDFHFCFLRTVANRLSDNDALAHIWQYQRVR